MFSTRKSRTLGLLVFSFAGLMFVAEAAAQVPHAQPSRAKVGKAQPGMVPGMMPQGMVPQGYAPPGAPQARQTKSRETFSIVEVGDEYQVVTATSLKSLKKQLKDEYLNAQKAYTQAKKDKNNKDAKKPEEKKVKMVPGKTGIKTQEKAQEELQKLQAKRSKTKR